MALIDFSRIAVRDLEDSTRAFQVANSINSTAKTLRTFGLDLGPLLRSLLPLLLAYLGSLVKGEDTAKPAPTPVPPIPVPESPRPSEPPPTPAPTPAARFVASIRVKYFWIAQEGKLLHAEDFQAVLNRSDPIGQGMRIALDATPYDQFGKEIGPPGDNPALHALLADLFWYKDGPEKDTSRLRWHGNNEAISHYTGGTHNYGCTPKLKIDSGVLSQGQEAETGLLEGVYTTLSGEEIHTNTLPSLRAKG